MKKINLISNSKKIKLEITIQNQIIWTDLDNIFCIMVLDLLSKITEDKKGIFDFEGDIENNKIIKSKYRY